MNDSTRPQHRSPYVEAAEQIRNLLHADACSIYVCHDGVGRDFILAGTSGWQNLAEIKTPTLRMNEHDAAEGRWRGLTSFVALTRQPLVRDDIKVEFTQTVRVSGEDRTLEVAWDQNPCELVDPQALLAVPIGDEAEILGVVRVMRSRCLPERPFSDRDKQQLQGWAAMLKVSVLQERTRANSIRHMTEIASAADEDAALEAIAAQAAQLVHGPSQVAAVLLLSDEWREGPYSPPIVADEDVRRDRRAGAPTFDIRAPKALLEQMQAANSKTKYQLTDKGLTPLVFNEGKPVLSGNLKVDCLPGRPLARAEHMPNSAELDPGKTRSWMAAPIYASEGAAAARVIGVIRVGSPHLNVYSPSDLQMLTALAQQTSLILDQRRRYRQQEMLFRTLVDTSESPVIAVDKHGRIIVFNAAVQRILGVSAADAKGKPISDVVYGGNETLARVMGKAIEKADAEGRAAAESAPRGARGPDDDAIHAHPLRDFYTLAFRKCPRTERKMPIPLRVFASVLRNPNDENEVMGTIGFLQDMRPPGFEDHVTQIAVSEPAVGEIQGSPGQEHGLTMDGGLAKVLGMITSTSEKTTNMGPVLIHGETGTGKELLVQAIRARTRPDKDLVPLNCASFKADLLEVELFGSVAGIFTGGRDREGIFIESEGGTVFLDEVTELSDGAQTKLLRALDKQKVRRQGEMHETPIDIQVITAANKSLEDLIKANKFRPDLYYRLRRREFRVPPLRERRCDIMLLAEYFREQALGRKGARAPVGFESKAIRALLAYAWPGNVRELRNAVEAAVDLFENEARLKRSALLIGDHLLPDAVQRALQNPDAASMVAALAPSTETDRRVDLLEREMKRLTETINGLKDRLAKGAAHDGAPAGHTQWDKMSVILKRRTDLHHLCVGRPQLWFAKLKSGLQREGCELNRNTLYKYADRYRRESEPPPAGPDAPS